MRPVAVVDKRQGETPLMALERFRAEARLGSVPLTYAGRLDPMASGMLLILIGDERHRKETYAALDKEYVFEILLGISSDSGDVLGLAAADAHAPFTDEQSLRTSLSRLRGSWDMPYPAYSSKPVEGKPLFEHARRGTLDSIEIPRKHVHIYELELLEFGRVSSRTLCDSVEAKLRALNLDAASTHPYRDFRRDEAVKRWKTVLSVDEIYSIAKVRAIVSSGTYIRELAPRIAAAVGTTGLAYSIRRTRIGRFVPLPFRGLWLRSYG